MRWLTFDSVIEWAVAVSKRKGFNTRPATAQVRNAVTNKIALVTKIITAVASLTFSTSGEVE